MKTLLIIASILATQTAAAADLRTYAIIIGNNGLPPNYDGAALEPLHFADDDAAAFYSFVRDYAARVDLLSVLDAATQARFPQLAARSQPPTKQALARSVESIALRVEEDRAAGHESEVIIFYSGHGTRGDTGATLTLLDAALTRDEIYGDVLAKLQAKVVHLVVDACYAEAIVRPRDASAPIVDVSKQQVAAWVAANSLRRFPHVGALIATAADQQAHEWDLYGEGIFTHQVLSGLRGGADINADGVVEYSELEAFLSAANRAVNNPKAKLSVVVQPPRINLRAPLIDLGRKTTVGWIAGDVSEMGHFHVEQMDGRRLFDLHGELAHGVRIAVPANEPLILRSSAGEAHFRVEVGDVVVADELAFQAGSTKPRGAVDSALRRGLFATPYGPHYYRGYTDKNEGVGLLPQQVFERETAEEDFETQGWIAIGASGALLIAAAATFAIAWDARADYNATSFEAPAQRARDRYDRYRYAAFGTGLGAIAAAGVGAVLLTW